MAEDEIIGKLQKFLNEDISVDNECCVVYLMVELRKLLDHQDIRDNYLTLRFYCDWTVHIQKDRNMAGISEIAEKIDKLVPRNKTLDSKTADYVFDFLRMSKLRAEMANFLKANNIPLGRLKEDNDWRTFASTLGEVLSGQPILNPILSIKSIELNVFGDGSSVDIDFDKGFSITVGKGIDVL